MEERNITRREFLRELGVAGAGALVLTSPWLKAFADVDATAGERLRLGMIGTGSRGQFLLSFLAKNPKADILAFADIYKPSLDAALKIVPTAQTYDDYHRLLDDKSIDAVVIATPLNTHHQIALDAFDAGKNVFCEKTIGYDMQQCLDIYNRH